ncbi:aldehyde dehydrogenase family protein [Polaromonas sp. YR568]|uniref:aldehyde dehydrogenase family protein n=1 Tax=Polaromonas sp. YR568 TaxID=1855301 RepID=UPI003137A0A5
MNFETHFKEVREHDWSKSDLSDLVKHALPDERGHYWGGQWHATTGGERRMSANPSTNENLADFAWGGPAEADAAVKSAYSAFPAWAATPPLERGRLLRRAADIVRAHAVELALIDSADCGNPIKAMLMDAEIAATQLEYFAGLVLESKGETIPTANCSLNYTLRQPLGVVARIFPFNHPFMFAAGKMAAPLAAGCTVVLKPPEQACLSTLRLMALLDGVFPPGVLNCVTGGRDVGAALASHPLVAAVGLIGSVPAGKSVLHAAADTMKHTLLELGGKNAMVIFPDADFDKAVVGAVQGMNFTWCGQSCGSTSRLFVHESLHNRFVEAIVAELERRHSPGLATDMKTTMGAMISEAQMNKTLSYIDSGLKDGAKLVSGGRRVTGLNPGFFVEPTIFSGVKVNHRIAREEIFGPVLSVLSWNDSDELFDDVNGTEFGLTASIWTKDLSTAHRAAARVEAGYVWVNGSSAHIVGASFGGFKQSGIGREESLQELHEFTQVKNVNVNLQ